MRVMGVDLSVTCTGVAFPGGETMALKTRLTREERRFYLAEHVALAARTARAELVVIEGLAGAYKGEAAREIPMLHGAVRQELRRSYLPYMAGVYPATLKQFATGNGNAPKVSMRVAAKRLLGTEYPTDDECDADWLRVAGLTAYGLPVRVTGGGVLDVAPERRRALFITTGKKCIVWPEVGTHRPLPPAGL